MAKFRWFLLSISVVVGLNASIFLLNLLGLPAAAASLAPNPDSAAHTAGDYVLLAWNDLGMHCYNRDFADLAVLPPFNTLWAQVIKVGNPPQVVTSGITVTYIFTDNTYSVGKTNFWSYAQQLFNLQDPLSDNIGLYGKGLSGTLDLKGDHFVAEGIPLTEYRDSAPTQPYPYQLATIIVKDTTTQAELARAVVVAPVSSEMRCDICHSDTGIATIEGDITPTGKVETNILALHDKENMEEYPAGHAGPLMDRRPVLCAECHASNALGASGVTGVPNLSKAMHEAHKEDTEVPQDMTGCYSCHPGPNTQCLRDVMSQEHKMTCINCHGSIGQVAQNPNPWLNEPRCDNAACHGSAYQQDQPLYRHSRSHGGLYCEGCHDSTHAIAPSREANDAIKFIALQGYAGTLDKCTVCHASQPSGSFQHQIQSSEFQFQLYLPAMVRSP